MYFLVHEMSNVQIFNAQWTSAGSILRDLDLVQSVFDIFDIEEFTICGNGIRLTMIYDSGGKIKFMYSNKYFYSTIDSSTRSYVIDCDRLVSVTSNEELLLVSGIDIGIYA